MFKIKFLIWSDRDDTDVWESDDLFADLDLLGLIACTVVSVDFDGRI